MTTATIGDRYQVVIPKRVREQLNIRPRGKMIVELRGRAVVMHPVTSQHWRGIGSELADGTDATAYIRKLRAEWNRQR